MQGDNQSRVQGEPHGALNRDLHGTEGFFVKRSAENDLELGKQGFNGKDTDIDIRNNPPLRAFPSFSKNKPNIPSNPPCDYPRFPEISGINFTHNISTSTFVLHQFDVGFPQSIDEGRIAVDDLDEGGHAALP